MHTCLVSKTLRQKKFACISHTRILSVFYFFILLQSLDLTITGIIFADTDSCQNKYCNRLQILHQIYIASQPRHKLLTLVKSKLDKANIQQTSFQGKKNKNNNLQRALSAQFCQMRMPTVFCLKLLGVFDQAMIISNTEFKYLPDKQQSKFLSKHCLLAKLNSDKPRNLNKLSLH